MKGNVERKIEIDGEDVKEYETERQKSKCEKDKKVIPRN